MSHSRLTAINENHLFRRELNIIVKNGTDLEVKIQTVDERKIVHVPVLDLKEIHIVDLAVAVIKVTTQTGVIVLDHTLNTSILDRVPNHQSKIKVATDGKNIFLEGIRIHSWGVESMTYLMTDEHIKQAARHGLPHRKRQDSAVKVERGSLGLGIMANDDVFGSEDLGENIL
jgi:hypothetical protein